MQANVSNDSSEQKRYIKQTMFTLINTYLCLEGILYVTLVSFLIVIKKSGQSLSTTDNRRHDTRYKRDLRVYSVNVE